LNIKEALDLLTSDDVKILRAIERYLKRYEFVPIELIEKDARLPPHKLERCLYKLNSIKLIKRQSASVLGYRLTILAYDVLAVISLMKRGTLEVLGERIGVGKESDVYWGLAPGGTKLAVKFHRVGRTSFRHVVRNRPYRVEDSWLLQSRISAQREFVALKKLHEVGAQVPKPIDRSRHVVVTELIEGAVELSEKPPLDDPVKTFGDIIETIAKAYHEVGIVHGDLSEYNIIVVPSMSAAYIIDWPQYIEKEHPLSEKLLRRDVEYVTRFFRKVYGVPAGFEEVLRAIKSGVSGGGP